MIYNIICIMIIKLSSRISRRWGWHELTTFVLSVTFGVTFELFQFHQLHLHFVINRTAQFIAMAVGCCVRLQTSPQLLALTCLRIPLHQLKLPLARCWMLLHHTALYLTITLTRLLDPLTQEWSTFTQTMSFYKYT